MIGHQQIVHARKQGFRPPSIFFDAGFDPVPAKFDFQKAERALAWNQYPTVTLPASELMRRHDLRFVVGCRVIVNGASWSDDFLHFLDRLAESAPSMIIACCIGESDAITIWENNDWRPCV